MRINLSVAQRTILAFAAMALLVVVGGGLGLVFATSSAATVDEVNEDLRQIRNVAQMERAWSQVASTVDRMLLTRQTAFAEQELPGQLALFNERLQALEGQSLGHSPDVVAENAMILDRLNSLADELNRNVSAIRSLAQAEDWARAEELRRAELTSSQTRFDDTLSLMIANIEDDVTAAAQQSQSLQRRTQVLWIVLAVLAIALALLLGTAVARSIIVPVEQIVAGAEKLASGRLAERVEVDRGDEMGQLADAFNSMAGELQASYQELEARVAERTRALRTSREVSRRISTILDQHELIAEVVEQVQSAFGYYHTHIYLFNDDRSALVMVGGTGEVGKELLARDHRLAPGQGLVGRTARDNRSVLALDVSEEPDWLPNPLLTETKAEIAVPISYGNRVLGVLDVQEDSVGGLDESDLELLESIARQVAIALQNALLLEEAERRAEQATLVNDIAQKIQRASTVEDVLRVAAGELGTALAVEEARVQLDRAIVADGNRGNF